MLSRRDPSVWGLLEEQAAARPDAVFAIDEEGVELRVADVYDRALRCAGALVRNHGIGRGDVVSWQLPNWLDTVVVCLALARLGAVQNPIVPIMRDREVSFITAQAGARLLIVPDTVIRAPSDGVDVLAFGRGGAPGADIELPAFSPDADRPERDEPVRWLFYTSGTTAAPKGARHTDATLLAAGRGVVDALAMSSSDRVATLLPLTHIGGVIRIITSLQAGSTMLLSAVFDPERSIPFLRDRDATMLPGAMPFLHAAFDVDDAHPELAPLFPAARMFIHGGSPKPPTLHREVIRRFGTVGLVSGYGMTECPMSVWNRPSDPGEALAATEGTPVPDVEIRITDLAGTPLPPGEDGEIRLRGPQLMLGYVDSALDADAFDRDGFIRSGDLGVLDHDGRLRVTGRLKDIIIRNMENISAAELEDLLHQHPGVREVAVVGLPSEVTGELACAVVVPVELDDPPSLAELCAHLHDAGLSTRKLPERLELVDALPRNAMDKVQKADLRSRFAPS